MKLLTAVSMAVMALSIAFNAKAYYPVRADFYSKAIEYIGIDDTEAGSVRWASLERDQHVLEPWGQPIKDYAKKHGQWNSESFKAKQARGAEWMQNNPTIVFNARSDLNACIVESLSRCIDYTILLAVHYHSVTLNGQLQEWYTADVIHIDRQPLIMQPPYELPTTMTVRNEPLQSASHYTIWF